MKKGKNSKISILFVCLGNICRSPSAEAVMKKLVYADGLKDKIFIDSAGTCNFHEGCSADKRMIQTGNKRGYNLTSISRTFSASNDFKNFDYIVCMDNSNIRNIKKRDFNNEFNDKIFNMTQFCTQYNNTEVPDPYYGGMDGFDFVFDLLEDACNGLLEFIKHKHRW